MIIIATGLTTGYIYIIEAVDAGGVGDNFITDHAGDPEDIDLDNYTEGTDYCKIEMPQSSQKEMTTGINVVDAGAYASYDSRAEATGYKLLERGLVTSRTNADLVEKFIMTARHCSGSSATFKRYYLIMKYGTDDYEKFIDHTSTQRKYCKGVITKAIREWLSNKNQVIVIRLHWRSVWTL